MEDWTQTLGTLPLLGIAAGAIALILVMIIVFKVHAFLTLIIVSLLTALVAGVPIGAIATTLTGGLRRHARHRRTARRRSARCSGG